MPRPRKPWMINSEPIETYFKPRSVPLSALEETSLTLDELEALKLSDLENLSQAEAAEKMDIHQSTFQRNLARARKKVADAIINAKAIKIEGGAYTMPKGDRTGPRGQGPMTGRGLGYCTGSQTPGYNAREIGRCRRGPCRRQEYYTEEPEPDTRSILEKRRDELKKELENIEKALSDKKE